MTLHLGVKETMFLFVTEQNLCPNMKDSKIPPGFPSLRTLYGACECGSAVFRVPAVSHRYCMPLPSNRKVISRRSKLKSFDLDDIFFFSEKSCFIELKFLSGL